MVTIFVFKLLLEVWLKCPFEVLLQDLLVELQCVHDLSDVLEVDCVRNAQTLHPVCMTPLLEVFLEGTTTPVACTAANLAFELLAKSMQFE